MTTRSDSSPRLRLSAGQRLSTAWWVTWSIVVLCFAFAAAMRAVTQEDALDTGRMCVVEDTKQYAPGHFTTILRDTETGVEYLVVHTQRKLVGRSSVSVAPLQAVAPAVAR